MRYLKCGAYLPDNSISVAAMCVCTTSTGGAPAEETGQAKGTTNGHGDDWCGDSFGGDRRGMVADGPDDVALGPPAVEEARPDVCPSCGARHPAIQRSIGQNAFARLGFSVLDLSGVGHGCPDLLVARNGVLYLVEVKGTRGVLTPDQVEFQASYRAPVYVVRTLEDVQRIAGAR